MIKNYRKTATIQAEQFDGSVRMIRKYSIGVPRGAYVEEWPMNTLMTLGGPMELNIGDWIVTGVKGEYWAIVDDVFKETYAEVTK